MRFSLLLLLLATMAALPSCQFLYPEPDPEEITADKDKPQFDEDYYLQNAKEYFGGGQYARAQQQWQTVLTHLNPDNWMARLGVASCDYYLGSSRVDRGDAEGGRTQLQEAEAGCRELWNGEIEADAVEAESQPVRQWQAALILALTHRALGDVDHLEILQTSQRLDALGPRAIEREDLRERLDELTVQRAANVEASLKLFERLVAMKNASQNAIINYAELLQTTGSSQEAERYFNEYLAIAEKSREGHIENLADAEAAPLGTRGRGAVIEEWRRKIRSNARKQVGVLVRLGNIHFDEGVEDQVNSDLATAVGRKRALRAESKVHFSNGLDYLRRARELEPERLDILVKMAQCEGRLELYESAIDNLDAYIAGHSRSADEWTENLSQAYRMKSDFEKRLQARQMP